MTGIEVLRALEFDQSVRNQQLLARTPHLRASVRSDVLPFELSPEQSELTQEQARALRALEKDAASIAIRAVASLGRVNDIDHLGGGLELIPALLMTLSMVDYDKRHFTIEHGHASIGYYASLAALGFLDREHVVEGFRRSLDIAGHVSWVPGGTQLSSGRLGVMMPVGAGFSLGLKAAKGSGSWVVCHCGDAGWVSGQALNGFLASSLHGAPISFVMHRNGIQLSGTTDQITGKDPRPIIEALGVQIIEIPSLHEVQPLFGAYREAFALAEKGVPSLIYPTGEANITLRAFARQWGIEDELRLMSDRHGVSQDRQVWIPGSLMSFRDAEAMLQCVFYVNGLAGGESHHDGGMKGRDEGAVLTNPMLQMSPPEQSAIGTLRRSPARVVRTSSRPPKGSPNLELSPEVLGSLSLPDAGASVTARVGAELAYEVLAKTHPDRCFVVSCDLDPSTRLAKAVKHLPKGHHFEMGIQEQAAALFTDGLAFAGPERQLNVFSTFTAFIEGIAREGFELWRYQRNLDGRNEGLNVVMHLSHVGTCTGRDHFSGWSLDWVNFSLGYLPFLRRFYAPADARAAFSAVRDAASKTGGHIVAIPRDNLPVLANEQGEPLWDPSSEWEAVTNYRSRPDAHIAILALGAPSFLAGEASDKALALGLDVDVVVVNGLPIETDFFDDVRRRYRAVITIEDGLIGGSHVGARGFAGYVATALSGSGLTLWHTGIVDPAVAPSEHYLEVWKHFGLTVDDLVSAIARLADD